MNDNYTYHIKISGQVNEGELNFSSPLHLHVVQAGMDETVVSLRTDQSGLVGLLRHLHGLSFVFISIIRIE